MSRVHHFQRYATLENTVTNNTLQLISRINAYSPRAASRLLSELTGELVEIGVEISQQVRKDDSVPDGVILQRSFKILVEAKVDAPVDFRQLREHAAGFTTETLKILLLLTKVPVTRAQADDLAKLGNTSGVVVRNITYESICRALKDLFKPHEESILELADDYVAYCNDTGLFDQSRDLMRVVPCGKSVAINQAHQIYFQPSDRGYSNHSYIGIYHQKAVVAVMDVRSVFDADWRDGVLTRHLRDGELTDRYDESIIATIADARRLCGYEIETGHRFFCGSMAPTRFEKVSAGGMQGARFFNLKELLGTYGSVDDIAQQLRGRHWQ
ncbi:hypothetical protein [Tahibacter amnicola]|uniref:Uncharacterized protein n=1 Tax=Tahibacter amnicola TaxID=2976241 RepID=A0ABY6B8G1_9GAMM|nr:hypothetical protein [Tahibacter amnicola]UXI65791.1 hypothetical protein N4264_13555 [Tahibacter amnicola]